MFLIYSRPCKITQMHESSHKKTYHSFLKKNDWWASNIPIIIPYTRDKSDDRKGSGRKEKIIYIFIYLGIFFVINSSYFLFSSKCHEMSNTFVHFLLQFTEHLEFHNSN